MTDYFALLGFDRLPWLKAEEVKARFLERSSGVHPDRVHGKSSEEIKRATEAFAQLNAAATTLANPKDRLQHFLALEGASLANTSQISGELMNLVWRVGQSTKEADLFLADKAKATSPMVQAQLFAQGIQWNDRLSELLAAVTAAQAQAENELQEISKGGLAEKSFDRLKMIAQTLAITGKWESQLKERFAALAAF